MNYSIKLLMPLIASCALLTANSGCRSGTGDTDPSPTSTNGSGGAGGQKPTKPLTIANWNVHNFVNDIADSGIANEWKDYKWDEHRANVGKVLKSLDADIVVLQEVEHMKVLEELNELELDGVYEHLALIDANDPRGIDNGVMSKLPLLKEVSHKDESFTKVGTQGPSYKYSRDCLEVHIEHNGRPIVLLGVHYKAKENDDPDKRLAEAQHTRAIADAITAKNPQTGVIILGDFNDTPGSVPYNWTIGEPPNQYGNAPDQIPAKDRWTFDYKGALELVDQQMANPLMYGMLNAASVSIPHTPEVEEASDHAPILARYDVY